ncbi:hypothetical protein V6Z11_D07G054600 [Gossypium hirsutum]|uniref:BHLH domain-containing protein n=2 Tax=Gossypium TaxID=3633 RepID=A0A5D2K2X9_GOSTO|nr:hypothetical protein ES288_D07G057800v1 [Gossypium darwinii]TYH61521.1 hypothetical protein ES332_D07G057700v1 [Gossypium tomentosum]
MASFSTKSNPFLIDSIFSPHKISGFVEEIENLNFDQVYSENNEPSGSIFKEQSSTGEFTVVDDIVALTSKKRRAKNGVKDEKEGKPKKQKKGNDEKKAYKGSKKDRKKGGEEPPNGRYIHVRARRGQATDSHSLAERVRRKKISERMEKLQRLVPGCDKITGKALILDEIINYVQSLESQVEFLSMKIATLNPMFYDLGVDPESFMVKPEMVNNISSPPQCYPTQPITTTAAAIGTAATFTPTNNIPLLDTSAAFLFHQGETSAVFSQFQDNGSVLWEVEGLRQEFLNPFRSF